MKNLQNILILFGVFAFCGLLYGFSVNKQNKQRVEKVDVNISEHSTIGFVDNALVENLLRQDGNYILGQAIDSIHVHEIENKVKENPFVADAEAFVALDGTFHVNIEQRKPVLRIVGAKGLSFYVDENGMSMPVSNIHVAKVIPCTGVKNIDPKFYVAKESIMENETILSAFKVALKIKQDDFFSKQFVQMEMDEDHEMVLIPRVGNHEIIFGSANDIESKLDKLSAFYEKGISQSNWNIYKTIDLSFEGQVVCKKR